MFHVKTGTSIQIYVKQSFNLASAKSYIITLIQKKKQKGIWFVKHNQSFSV